ncbi:MAG: biosynthetic arginine decarboxylase [Gammaproteobacteria bacterium]|nr:biosynthetic arginine decarboxylase [Gammaproteobacteria bacterium]
MKDWTSANAKALYNIQHWSGGYFDINAAGNLIVSPGQTQAGSSIDLYQLVQEINQSALSLPCLVRFPHILRDRVETLRNAFASAIGNNGYQGRYKPVYPIKVNQEQSVVNELVNTGNPVGLEAGSKPELMAVLALANSHNGIIVCNGYKDREYIRLALIGKALGHTIYIVLEKPTEVDIVIKESKALDIEPSLGIRIRLDSIGVGKWQNTGGEKSKFGFSSSQALDAIEKLKSHDLLGCLELLHFHLGSQITNIEDIQKGITEGARYYAELHRAGATRLDTMDVGGGLGIDYEGTRSRSYFSMNYSINDYANTIISTIAQITRQQNLKHPHIITESGRAMVAHHAVLIVDVIETEQMISASANLRLARDAAPVTELNRYLKNLQSDNCQLLECYHGARQTMDGIKQKFNEGSVTLKEKAACEQIFYDLCDGIRKRLNSEKKSHRETLDELNEKLADKYFCNFSLFQSLPDVWAINQIFPIVPLHRLNEKPEQRGTIHDITCDSDGRIDFYVDEDGVEASLPLHSTEPGQPYFLGIFLVGAYQEILGDMHNLFGDTNSVNVELTGGSYSINQASHGDSVDYVLRHVHYDTDEFIAVYKTKLNAAELSESQRDSYFTELKAGLTGYTYLEE